MEFVKVYGMYDHYDEDFEPFELWVNVSQVVAVRPDERSIVMNGDGCLFYCTPESFDALVGVMREVS